jgi:hypothetical protein
MLYDWERLGQATAAIDLAITIPGLSDWQAFGQVATQYLAAHDAPQSAVHQLTYEIALAKVWNVTEFLSLAALGQVADTSGVPSLVQRLPAWLVQVARWTA